MRINREFIHEVGAARWIWRTFLRQTSKRILRRDNHITLPTGLRMTLPRTSKFASEVFITRCDVDWGSEALFARHLDAKGIVLDVGANIGYYSLYVLPLVSAVHAFEPDPTAYATLQQNLVAHASCAFAYPVAVGNWHGTAQFAVEHNSEISHLVENSINSAPAMQDVNITTIDRFVADLLSTDIKSTITGIKIDVEGADFQVLQGAFDTLRRHHPLVLTETSAEDRLFDFLQPMDYRVFAFTKKENCRSFQFQEVFADSNLRTKMLFLVPPRLHSLFAGHDGQCMKGLGSMLR